jgi:UDP-2-acetamido-2,6-beta-L-arabino-hexul-4-ose reductase
MIKKLEKKIDKRGELVEVFKFPEIGQVFYIITKPGVTRGNHYHKRKIEKFCVIEGFAELVIKNKNSGEIKKINLSGDSPTVVSIPPNHIHNIKNIGEIDMFLLVWVNEIFNPSEPDTYAENI